MRRHLALLPLLALAACTGGYDDRARDAKINRLVLSQTIGGTTAESFDDSAFKKVYIDEKLSLGLFFTGGGSRYTAHFVDSQGLIDMSRLMSVAAVNGLSYSDPGAEADRRANRPLGETGLPDREFRVIGAENGYLTEALYGKAYYLSYILHKGDKLKLGFGIDEGLLAKLASAGGMGGDYRRVAALGTPAESTNPGSLLSFAKVPDKLRDLLVGNTAALYREVDSREDSWDADSALTLPSSESDTTAIEAIRAKLAGTPITPSSTDIGGDMISNDTPADAVNAM
jgi:hypothetical protein